MKSWRSLLPFALLIIAATVITLTSLRQDAQRVTGNVPSAAREAIYVAETASWVRHDVNGVPQLRAEAQRIDYYDNRAMTLQTVKLDDLGGPNGAWHLEAAQGEVPPGETKMQLKPEVAVTGKR